MWNSQLENMCNQRVEAKTGSTWNRNNRMLSVCTHLSFNMTEMVHCYSSKKDSCHLTSFNDFFCTCGRFSPLLRHGHVVDLVFTCIFRCWWVDWRVKMFLCFGELWTRCCSSGLHLPSDTNGFKRIQRRAARARPLTVGLFTRGGSRGYSHDRGAHKYQQ